MLEALPKKTCVTVLLVYAGVLLALLSRTPLWLDEVLQLGVTRDHRSVSQLLDWVRVQPGASPLPYLAQKALLDTVGFSTFAARLPAALCSIASGLVFWMIAGQLKLRSRILALAIFLAVPLQFRYGIEARVYSQGLLLSLVSLWLFLRLCEAPSRGRAAIYGASLMVGLYSQPLTLFPALAQALFSFSGSVRRFALPAVAAAALVYAPWYIAQSRAQAGLVQPFGFSFRQAAPLTLLHDLAGDGYACSLPLALLAAWSAFRRDLEKKSLFLWTIALSIAGPIVMDRIADYFFAGRQLLFALPALVLLASQGVERARPHAYVMATCGLLAVFFAAAGWNDFRQGVIPRDDLSATADALSAGLQTDSCFLAPPGESGYYIFFRPELKNRACPQPPSAPEVLAVASAYAKPEQRQALPESLSGAYQRVQVLRAGRTEIAAYRRR